MASTTDTQLDSEDEQSSIEALFVQTYNTIRGSFLHFMMAAGVVVTILGWSPLFLGEPAALMGITGVSLILYGLIGIAALRLIGYSG